MLMNERTTVMLWEKSRKNGPVSGLRVASDQTLKPNSLSE